MSQIMCPQGHESAEADFCSVCGTKMSPAQCPACGAAREPGSTFCQDCGYNYTTGARPASWTVSIEIDPSLRTAESPDPPAGFETRTLRLEGDSSLIGRRSDKRAIFPEIALDFDDAVSHRHAVLTKTREGGLIVRDLGSANGTRLNGSDLQPLTDTALNNGDKLTLGHWTRLSVRTTT